VKSGAAADTAERSTDASRRIGPRRRLAPRTVLLALLLALPTPGCLLFQHPKGIAVSSDPPGASVLVGQRDTGFVTPCVLEVDPDDDERIDFVRPGYMTETRYISPDWDVYAILYREMSVEFSTWDFPLFLNFRDFFVPVKVSDRISPNRIHVRLEREADHVAPGSR
jgi:hypothetical protein